MHQFVTSVSVIVQQMNVLVTDIDNHDVMKKLLVEKYEPSEHVLQQFQQLVDEINDNYFNFKDINYK